MIDQHERERVRDAIGEMLGRATPAPGEPPASVIAAARTVDEPRPRLPISTIAAVAVALAGLGGLFALAGRGDDAPAIVPVTTSATAPPTTVASGPRPLSEVEALAPTDWVITTAIPDGYEYLYAMHDPRPARFDDTDPTWRRVVYGEPVADATRPELFISIDDPPDGPAETVTIAGSDWQINRPGLRWWNATQTIGESTVTISSRGEIDEAALAGLQVVDGAGLPFPPFGNADDALVVARAQFGGAMNEWAVQRSGSYQCDWVLDSGATGGGIGGGCASRADPSAVVTINLRSDFDPGPRPGTIETLRGGSVTPEAATVEVEFADGTTVRVEPTDLSGTFDVRFWLVAAILSDESRTGVPVSQETLAAVRAYDVDGDLLGTAVPPGLLTADG